MERASQVIGQSGPFLDALERASRAAALVVVAVGPIAPANQAPLAQIA